MQGRLGSLLNSPVEGTTLLNSERQSSPKFTRAVVGMVQAAYLLPIRGRLRSHGEPPQRPGARPSGGLPLGAMTAAMWVRAICRYGSVSAILRLWSLVRVGSFQMDLRMYEPNCTIVNIMMQLETCMNLGMLIASIGLGVGVVLTGMYFELWQVILAGAIGGGLGCMFSLKN